MRQERGALGQVLWRIEDGGKQRISNAGRNSVMLPPSIIPALRHAGTRSAVTQEAMAPPWTRRDIGDSEQLEVNHVRRYVQIWHWTCPIYQVLRRPPPPPPLLPVIDRPPSRARWTDASICTNHNPSGWIGDPCSFASHPRPPTKYSRFPQSLSLRTLQRLLRVSKLRQLIPGKGKLQGKADTPR